MSNGLASIIVAIGLIASMFACGAFTFASGVLQAGDEMPTGQFLLILGGIAAMLFLSWWAIERIGRAAMTPEARKRNDEHMREFYARPEERRTTSMIEVLVGIFIVVLVLALLGIVK